MPKIFLDHSDAKIPTKANPTDAGFDLYSVENVIVSAKTRKLINTGVRIALDDGTYGRIAPRSGLALKYGIDVFAGVVDFSYRNCLGVILYNSSDEDFEVRVGDRIAQLILEKISNASFEEVHSVSELGQTERGEKGFGSSGI